MTPITARSPAIDVVRVLAIVFIVFRHTFVVPLQEQSILFSWTVPFFFFLTGWLWKPGSRSVREEVGRRWYSLGLPYVSWFAIIWMTFVVISLASGSAGLSRFLKPFAGSVHAARPFTTFWFISALFFVAVLYRLIDRLAMIAQLGIAVFLLAVGWAVGPLLAKLPLSIGTATACLAFVIFGRFLKQFASNVTSRLALLAVSVVLLVVLASPVIPPIDVKYGFYGALLVSACVSLALCWAVVVLANFLFERAPRAAAALQRPARMLTAVAMCVILTHPFVLYLLGATRADARWWHYLTALIVPWALGLALAKTPVRKYLIGG